MAITDSGQGTEAWIGLWKQASVPTVEWSDGSPVTFTFWHQYHPPHNLTATALCAKADSKVGKVGAHATSLIFYFELNHH